MTLTREPDFNDWISGNFYLSEEEMQNNAINVCWWCWAHDWTLEATAGLLGNMETESTINPGIWENLEEVPQNGFGLVQWTPSTRYTSWLERTWGGDITDGDNQMICICEYAEELGQWIETDEYPITFEEFYSSTESPEYLASVFLKNYERAGVEAETERQEQARKWYEYLNELYGEGGDTPVTPKKKKMPLYMMCRRWY